ncbi:MAG: hypothetical protein ACUZ8E_12310 [Candidatus Anammoxibacter sp.]
MNEKDGFKTILSATLKDGGSMSMSFSIPKELQPFALSYENIKRAIEYYLLARYAYFHKMDSAFMINSFWAIEHLILSLLIFKVEDKEELKSFGGYHSITSYWKAAKEMLPAPESTAMNKFDDYIGKIQGYFSERYPSIQEKGKLQFTGKSPRITLGSSNKVLKFGKVAHLSLEELDNFVNFMLHDITVYKKDCSGNLMGLLASQDNMKLYKKDNNYSVVYPNKVYHGELL